MREVVSLIPRRVHGAWVAASLFVILVATLPPQPSWQTVDRRVLLVSIPDTPGDWFDVVQNVVLYLPLGIFLSARRASTLATALIAVAVSGVTEWLQFGIPGRDPSVRDVLANAAGALAGTVVTSQFSKGLSARVQGFEDAIARACRASGRRADALLLGWSLVVLAIITATGVLLAPSSPAGVLSIASPAIDRTPGPLRIGRNGSENTAFRGAIDEVRVFRRARTEAQIRSDMQLPSRRAWTADDGLVAAFGFDDDAPDIARDDSGRGHDGFATNAPLLAEGRIGAARRFDGSTSEIVSSSVSALDLAEGMTLEAWIRPEGPFAAAEPSIVSGGGSDYFMDQGSSHGPLYPAGGAHFGDVPRYASSRLAVRAGRWTHMATTYDGRTIRLYVDGVIAGSKVHWSPHRAHKAMLNGAARIPGDVSSSDTLRNELNQRLTLDLSVTCGRRDSIAGPIFLISGLHDADVLAIHVRDADVLVAPWTRARRLHLASPPSIVTGALTGCEPGQLTQLQVIGTLQRPDVLRDGRLLPARIPGLGHAWAFVFHSELLPGWLLVLCTGLWLALLAIPVGLLARGIVIAVGTSSAIVACSFAVAFLLQIRPLGGDELTGFAAGVAVGFAWRRLARSPD